MHKDYTLIHAVEKISAQKFSWLTSDLSVLQGHAEFSSPDFNTARWYISWQ